MKITKSIFINNLSKLEEYLGLNPCYDSPWLHSLELRQNTDIKGVRALLEKIPAALDQVSMQRFYEDTGLHILVERYDSSYSMTCEDRKGRYPREFMNVFNPDDTWEQISEHPEWLEPQDQPDLIIRYVSEIAPVPKQRDYQLHIPVTRK